MKSWTVQAAEIWYATRLVGLEIEQLANLRYECISGRHARQACLDHPFCVVGRFREGNVLVRGACYGG